MPKVKTYNCLECDKVYKTSNGLAKHLVSVHHPVNAKVAEVETEAQPVLVDNVPPAEKEVDKTEAQMPQVVINNEAPKKAFPFVPTAIVLVVAVLLFIFIRQGCKSKEYREDLKEVADSTKVIDNRAINIDSMLNEYRNVIIDSMADVNATKDRIQTEKDGEQKRQQAKTTYEAIKKQLSDSTISDDVRDRIADQLIRERQIIRARYNKD